MIFLFTIRKTIFLQDDGLFFFDINMFFERQSAFCKNGSEKKKLLFRNENSHKDFLPSLRI